MFIRSSVCVDATDPPSPSSSALITRQREMLRRHLCGEELAEALTGLLNATADVEQRLVALEEEIRRLRQLALTDELTGLMNRRGFRIELERALGLARRHGETGALVIVDLDGFKLINDGFGHAAGDAVLRQVGMVLAGNVRATDIVARLGGDEFGVLMLRSNSTGAANRAAALDRVLNATVALHGGQVLAVRASVGYEVFGPDSEADALFARADAEMYRRKQQRPMVVSLAQSIVSDRPPLQLRRGNDD